MTPMTPLGFRTRIAAAGVVEAKLVAASRWRRIGLALAGLAGIALLASIPLNERAVQGEGGGVGHEGSQVLAVAALLALATFALSVRAALGVGKRGIAWPAALALFTAGAALFGALVASSAPIMVNIFQACLANAAGGAGLRLEVVAVATPGPCGYQIPTSDYPLFYPAALAALIAVGLGIVAAVSMILGRTPRNKRPGI